MYVLYIIRVYIKYMYIHDIIAYVYVLITAVGVLKIQVYYMTVFFYSAESNAC